MTGTPAALSRRATPSVSSPPIGTSASMPSCVSAAFTRSSPSGSAYGFVLDVPRIVPPRGRMPFVASAVSSRPSPASTPAQPYVKPWNSKPWASIPRRTTPRMTAFNPGQSPPPVRTPTRMGVSLSLPLDAHVHGRALLELRPGRRVLGGHLPVVLDDDAEDATALVDRELELRALDARAGDVERLADELRHGRRRDHRPTVRDRGGDGLRLGG